MPLDISCVISDISNVSYAALKINGIEIQYVNLTTNQSTCSKDHSFYKNCLENMNGTHRSGDGIVSFVANMAWQGLDGKTCQCFIRYNGYGHDKPGPIRIISLQG